MTLDVLCCGLTLTYHMTSCNASNASVTMEVLDGPSDNYTTDVVIIEPAYETHIVGVIEDRENDFKALIYKEYMYGELSFGGNNQVGTPMVYENMYPGDSETGVYNITVTHNFSELLHFEIKIHDDEAYEKLAEVLKVKVSINGFEKYDGLIKDFTGIDQYVAPSYTKVAKDTYEYSITVYLETSVGNEYMNKALVCDYIWTIYEEDESANVPDGLIPIEPDWPSEPDVPDVPEEPDDDDEFIEDEVEPDTPEEAYDEIIIFDHVPETCYAKQMFVVMGAAFLALAIIYVRVRRKGENYEK